MPNPSEALLKLLTDTVHQAAIKAELIDTDHAAGLTRIIQEAKERSHSKTFQQAEKSFARFTEKLGTLFPSPGETAQEGGSVALHFSELLGLDAIASNALGNVLQAREAQLLLTRFEAIIQEAVESGNTEQLNETLDLMIVSLVHTMHPTIYHSAEAMELEHAITETLEEAIPESVAGNSPIVLSPEALEKIGGLIGDFAKRLKEGKVTLTPDRPVTVSQETKREISNLAAIRRETKAVVDAWNGAAKLLGQPSLVIDAARAHRIFERRTWRADADGRQFATAIQLYEDIRNETAPYENAPYEGVTFDPRQNARVHRDFLSALVQKKFKHSASGQFGEDRKKMATKAFYGKALTFHEFCEAFMETRKARGQYTEGGWHSPGKSIFQQLTAEDQAEFVRQMIHCDFRLIPPQVEEDVRELMPKYLDYRNDFLAKYRAEIAPQCARAGIDPERITYKQMQDITVTVGEVKVDMQKLFRIGAKRHGFEFSQNGLGLNRDLQSPGDADKLMVEGFLEGRKTYNPKTKELEQLTVEDRVTLMDTIKRLYIFRDAIEKHGPALADRHQIANFSSPADFYVMLKLMQEAGLIDIEKDRVTKTMMGIQPLIETIEDMQAAPATFRTLLDDPLILSYYRTRGVAEIMVGFSDGASSAGNFASQWHIYKSAQALSELFAEYGIPLRVLQGRGRGVDRGGTIDPATHMALMPPNLAATGIYDATIQSDLPSDMANCQSGGRNYLAAIFEGTIRERAHALNLTSEEKDEQAALEPAIDWIARRAAEIYAAAVRDNDEALAFLNRMPDNANRSSRAPVRGVAKKYDDFDSIRAITKEYEFNGACLSPYNVGLKEALLEFSSLDAQALGALGIHYRANGRPAGGAAMVQALGRHRFFRNMLPTAEVGLAHYDPVIARAYGRATGTENFVESTIAHLNGSWNVIDAFMEKRPPAPSLAQFLYQDTPFGTDTLGQVGHAMMIAAADKGFAMRPSKDLADQGDWWAVQRNLLFVNAQEVAHRVLPRRKGQGI